MKVACFGHFGSTNPGNESTLLAFLARLRATYPDSHVVCISDCPEIAASRYGVQGIAITTRSARLWNRDLGTRARIAAALAGVRAELRQYRRAVRAVRGTELLVIPGTGLLTDAYGLSHWGPYGLFKWVLAAKLGGARVLFASVGAGPIDGTAGRALTRAALSMADYRSYRDLQSRDYVRALGVRSAHDDVYPDLVFGLPDSTLPAKPARPASGRRVVGLGLMEHAKRYSVVDPRPETYARYLESLAVFAAWLLEHDYDIRLLLGDADTHAIDDFRSMLRSHLGSYDEDRIVEHPITSVDDVLGEIAATDAVVATRFHNVLLAMMLRKPVIALSFHPKCSSLMTQMRLSEYCHGFEELDAERLISQFEQLERERASITRRIGDGIEQARTALDEQYDRVLSSPTDTQAPRERLETAFLARNEQLWARMPPRVRELGPVRSYGAWLHTRVRRHANRDMYTGTLFMRNRPALELMRRLAERADWDGPLRIAVLGCSIGVEVYSILWTLRSRRPDLDVAIHAVDISPEVVRVAQRGAYGPEASELVSFSIFDGLTAAERRDMFDWDGEVGTVKPWLRDGITWHVGDVGDPELVAQLGPQDLVIASNFLCHMPPAPAGRCLRSFAPLATPGGHLFITGVDLDVRTEAARELGWEPVSELRAEIHDGDALVRSDWPWRWWGLEPLDRRRPDWELRYTSVFRAPGRHLARRESLHLVRSLG